MFWVNGNIIMFTEMYTVNKCIQRMRISIYEIIYVKIRYKQAHFVTDYIHLYEFNGIGFNVHIWAVVKKLKVLYPGFYIFKKCKFSSGNDHPIFLVLRVTVARVPSRFIFIIINKTKNGFQFFIW